MDSYHISHGSLCGIHSKFVYTSVLISSLLSSSGLRAGESPDGRYSINGKSATLSSASSLHNNGRILTGDAPGRENTAEPEASPSRAVDILDMEVIENSGQYRIKLSAVIRAPAYYVRKVLADFSHIYRLNPSILESEILDHNEDDDVLVRTKVIGCAAYFCEEIERVESVQLLPSGDIVAEIVPEMSQFKSGKTYWQIKPYGEHCMVAYQSDMEPDIYIPPVVGKFLIKKSIKQEIQISFTNLGIISRVLAARENDEVTPPGDNCDSLELAAVSQCANEVAIDQSINQ